MKVTESANKKVRLLRLTVELSVAALLFATAVGSLSGSTWLQRLFEENTLQKKAAADSSFANRAESHLMREDGILHMREHLKKAGLFPSACYRQGRTNANEYLVCIGAVPCEDLRQASMGLNAAPNIVNREEFHRKAFDVIRKVTAYLSQQLGTTDLSIIFHHAAKNGLVCDNLLINQTPMNSDNSL